MAVSPRLPPEVWSRILQPLHGPDKANAAQTCRDARKGGAAAWTAEDYWHAASGGERLCSFTGQVPHVALPRAPTSATWRSLAQEIGIVRTHVYKFGDLRHSDSVVDRWGSPLPKKRPGSWLQRAAIAAPPSAAARGTRWTLTVQALQGVGRRSEAAALESLRRDYLALQNGLFAADVAAVEPLLKRGLPLPPPNPVRPSIVPILAQAACQQGRDGVDHLVGAFIYSDEDSAQTILAQPAFAATDLAPSIAERLILRTPHQVAGTPRKAQFLAAACGPAQADAVIARMNAKLTVDLRRKLDATATLMCSWSCLYPLLPLWSARGASLEHVAERAVLMTREPADSAACQARLRVLQEHGADLDALLRSVLRSSATFRVRSYCYGKLRYQSENYHGALHALGRLGARISQADYEALLAAQPDGRDNLRHTWAALVAGGALSPSGVLSPAARLRAHHRYHYGAA